MVWKRSGFLMSTSDEKPAFGRVLSGYLVPVIAVCFAVISTLWSGPALKHSSAIFFCSVMLSSWYGGLLPGLFAAVLSWLALDYYFVPPIDSLAMNPDEVPAMIIFGAAACFISWLNSGARRVSKPLGQDREIESSLGGIVVKFSLAVSLSVASCLAAAVTTLIRSGGSWEYLWLTIGFAACCSGFFLIILASRDFL
jgi:K+-sensing histidine kinase KdpD